MGVFLLNYDTLFKVVKQLFVSSSSHVSFHIFHAGLRYDDVAHPGNYGQEKHVDRAGQNCCTVNWFIEKYRSSYRDKGHLQHGEDHGWPPVEVAQTEIEHTYQQSQMKANVCADTVWQEHLNHYHDHLMIEVQFCDL